MSRQLFNGLISLSDVKRRRHGTYTEPTESMQQVTVWYSVPLENVKFEKMCKKTFMNVIDVTKQKEKKSGYNVY